MHAPTMSLPVSEPTSADKLALLRQPDAYAHACGEVATRETHMSWLFFAGNRVYKLKKPVRFPFLDFSTLARRERACRAEFALNRRLARDVYLGVTPLTVGPNGLSIGGDGAVVDWVVVMRRLDEAATLEHAILSGSLRQAQLDELVSVLAQFYRTTRRVFVSPAHHFAVWQRNLAYCRRVLLERRLGLPAGLVRYIDGVQWRFLVERAALVRRRAIGRSIVDGHGDLRPEHIWLDHAIRIIDCLEFNPSLRAVDPLDEVAFLCLECERLGCRWAADYVRRRMSRALLVRADDPLFAFYRCYRASLRASLAIAHLLEPNPRTPEKWPPLARTYLQFAQADARLLERVLRTP